MLYLIMTATTRDKNKIYTIFETHTESKIRANTEFMVDILTRYKMKSKNIYIENGELKIKEWPHPITDLSNYEQTIGLNSILIGKIEEKKFKIINSSGHAQYINKASLQKLIRLGKLANCNFETIKQKNVYKSIDTCKLEASKEFEENIAEKYAQFMAKCRLLGLNMTFKYIIEDADIKITKYTGTSTRVIIPKFITTVCSYAFEAQGIKELTLNSGLVYIGTNAFKNNKLELVNLPTTIKFIGESAFEDQDNGVRNNDVIKKLSNSTLILTDTLFEQTMKSRWYSLIYIIGTIQDKDGNTISYTGFDARTDSSMNLPTELLKHIIEDTTIKVVNASVQNKNIVIKEWPHKLSSSLSRVGEGGIGNVYSGPNFVLLALESIIYKAVDCCGYTYSFYENELVDMAWTKNIANCILIDPDIAYQQYNNSTILTTKRGDKILALDISIIKTTEEFKNSIKEKYNAFIAKAIMLGYGKITFKYTLENQEVKLTEYTGSSKNVILPPFVSHIMSGAFSGLHLETLKISEGLKTIGKHSFQANELSHVEIPESVELVGVNAFSFNAKLYNGKNSLRRERFILQNSKTIVLNE